MDNNKQDPSSIVDGWMKDILKKLDISDDQETPSSDPLVGGQDSPVSDLQADEQAIASAGLIHPDDVELEQIIKETHEESWNETPTSPISDETRMFTAPQLQPQHPVEDVSVPYEEELVANDTVAADVEDASDKQSEDTEPSLLEDSATRKLRPKPKKGYGLLGIPHILSTAIWLFLILAIGVSLGRTVWLCAKDLLALGKEPISVSITITSTDTVADVAQKLKDAGLIEYPKLFTFFTDLTGKCENMIVGTIELNSDDPNDPDNSKKVFDYNALANALTYRGTSRVTVDVMIPEGYNCAQIFSLMEEKGVCKAADLEAYAESGTLDGYWFLAGVKRGHKYCLEGFLFPDTYEFYLDDEPERVIRKMLNGFDNRFSDSMVDKFVALNNKTKLNLSLQDVVTMASIVEKEKASDPEGYNIASVFYNRLTHSGTYPLLQSDATIKYDVEYRSKGQLTTDAQINASPYNTYMKKGLPPGPIANPGLASLNAALDPEETDYYFFVYDKQAGVHQFSKTYAEHNAWVKKLGLDK